jgi:phage shock protein A
MQLLIETIEEQIYSHKSQMRYHQEEQDRISRQMAQTQWKIDALTRELAQLKRLEADQEARVTPSEMLRKLSQ